jgi:ABC-type multidrug transport system fused ATPase/permease subunit
MAIFLSVWRLLDRRQHRQLIGLGLLAVAMGLSTVGGIAAVLPFFAALADPNTIRHNTILRVLLPRLSFADDTVLVVALGVAFAALVLIANTINLAGFLAINRFAFRVGETLYVRLFAGYMQRDYLFHTRNHSSVLATRVLHETARVTSGILLQGLILMTSLVTIVCVAASMLLVNPVAAAGTIVGLGATYAAIYALARARLLRNGQIESRYDAERRRTVNESFAAIREITLLQARDSFVMRFTEQCRAISLATCNTIAIAYSPRYILECITVFCLIGVALYLHSHTGTYGPWIAQLSFVGFAAYRLLPALQQSFAAVVRIRSDRPAFAAIHKDLERRPLQPGHHRIATLERSWGDRPRREIRLHEVSFRYAPERPEAVSGVSLVLPAAQIIGFVGPNGSGKSTLLDLICGLLTPQSGHIEIDGVRLGPENCAAWQSAIAYVPQQVFLFDATLAENIACGVPVAQINHERLEAAVRLARLTECVACLPHRYAEMLGERGCRLSGGQRQRLAIARALYRGASMLILDEATSSLDAAAEGEIVETLLALRPEKTILVSAHRAAAARRCDLVFELRNGGLVGSGTSARTTPEKAHWGA